jgi:hypothetical protein
MRLNLTNSRIEIYLAEGLMLKAPVAPFPLMVSCSKSWTTVDTGRCAQCHPSNIHREVDEADQRKKKHHHEGDEDVPSKKRTASSREDALQKSDRPHKPERYATPRLGGSGARKCGTLLSSFNFSIHEHMCNPFKLS